MEVVLDSHALIAFLENEPAAGCVHALLQEAAELRKTLLLNLINWGEVLYAVERRHGMQRKEEVKRLIDQMPIEIIPIDRELTIQAATYKAKGKISYADCFAAALAKLRKAELVTGDKEFKAVEKEIKILWL